MGTETERLELMEAEWTTASWPPIRVLILPDGTVAVEDENGDYITEEGDVYALDDEEE